MHFLIFIPEDPGTCFTPENMLKSVGIDYKENVEQVPLSADFSPAGTKGRLFTWDTLKGNKLAYQPEQQTWKPAIADKDLKADRYWIGFWDNSPPTPKQLVKHETYPGKLVQLKDGNSWLVPAARFCPHQYLYDDDGQMAEVICDEFREFWEMSARFVQELLNFDEQSVPQPTAEWAGHAADALMINYRITPEVINHLNLLNNQNVVECVGATVCKHEILEELAAQKKSELPPEEPYTPPGSKD